MTTGVVLLQLAVLAVVLESDLGRRRVSAFRVWRPVVTVALVVPFFLTTIPGGTSNLLLQLGGALAGAALGALAASPVFVGMAWDPAFRSRHLPWSRGPRPAVVTRAGVTYATVWIAACVLRLTFAYCAEHVFGADLARFLADDDLSGAALGNAFAFLAITMSVSRSLVFAVRAEGVRRRHRASPPVPDARDRVRA